MCFSTTASFAVAAGLVPIGVYCLRRAVEIDRKWVPLAIFPLAFSLQQAIEGFVWIGINTSDSQVIAIASRGFLFFSHFFWLVWAPFAVFCIESDSWRKHLALGLTILGTVFGLSIFVASFVYLDWLVVVQEGQSLNYKTTLIYDGYVSRSILKYIYALIIVSALIISSTPHIRIFGVLILASVIVTSWLFPATFISVWCFVAAILSAYIVAVFAILARRKSAIGLASGGTTEH